MSDTWYYITKLKRIISEAITHEKYEMALCVEKVLTEICYEYNQFYTDSDLEKKLLLIRDAILEKKDYCFSDECVLFYDGFGLDLRGWAASYIRALSNLGYKVIYVCPLSSKGKIPHIISEIDFEKSCVEYLDDKIGCIEKTKKIDSVFKKYRPKAAFFYTTPDDVEAAVAFSNNSSTTRFQIDLTDHAYWVGTNAFDYIFAAREMSVSIDLYERNIPRKSIIRLDCVPYIIHDRYDEKLPFDIKSEKYVFTGGALYKTLGDEALLYYKTIRHVLTCFPYVKFLYLGSGDSSEIEKLRNAFPGRVFLTPERSDFYEIMKNCILYVNSYPMFGGLMMRYAALAGKIPITLKHDEDAEGILINQKELEIEYSDYDEYIAEIDRLLSDDCYRKNKEKRVINSVMTEEDFERNLHLIIEDHRSEYSFPQEIEHFDTTKFREEYKNRYKKTDLYKAIAKKQNTILFRWFPLEFILGAIIKVKGKVFR